VQKISRSITDEEFLSLLFEEAQAAQYQPVVIRDAVCEYFSLSIDAISTKSRKREVVQARQIAMYLSKQLTKSSLASIGNTIGQRDHATVLHACKIVNDLMDCDKNFRSSVREIEEKLKR